jgi:DNA polymerase III, delta subunit
LRDTTKEFLAEKGKRLTAGASLALERMTGSDLREFRGALEKLVIYTGDRSLIEEKDVGAVIERAKEDSIFDLTSALAGKNLKRALLSLNDIQDGGVHYLVILTMVYREIRLLLHAKIFLKSERMGSFYPEMDYNRFQNSVYPDMKKLTGQSGERAGERAGEKSGGFASQHPYVIYKALRNSGRFSFENLVGHLEALADADLILKTTGKNPRLVLERLLIDITA